MLFISSLRWNTRHTFFLLQCAVCWQCNGYTVLVHGVLSLLPVSYQTRDYDAGHQSPSITLNQINSIASFSRAIFFFFLFLMFNFVHTSSFHSRLGCFLRHYSKGIETRIFPALTLNYSPWADYNPCECESIKDSIIDDW